MSTVTVQVPLTVVQCGPCGGVYAINNDYHREKLEKGGYWTCPYCKCGWGFGESEVTRLRNQLAKEKHNVEQARARADDMRQQRDAMDMRRRAMKGQVTKIRNRVGKGVCPCCNRTFTNLQRHMTNQHPEWAPEKEADGSEALSVQT